MNKPISMIIDDTKTTLVKICNDSNLPLCILEMIVKDMYNEIQVLSQNQLKNDKALWEQSLVQQEIEKAQQETKQKEEQEKEIGESNE